MSSIKTYTDIDIKLYESQSITVVQKQNDNNTRYIRIRLIDRDGEVISLDGLEVCFIMRTSKKAGFIISSFDSDPRVVIEDNQVVVRFNQNMLADAGMAQAEVRLIDGGKTLSSTKFSIYIEPAVSTEGAKESVSDYPTIEQVIELGKTINDLHKVATQTSNGLMSSSDKVKLDNTISNVQADWNEEDNTSDAYIKNKPTVDETLDKESTNAIQNKAVTSALEGKANAEHEHIASDITDFPSSLPANGGNSDTVNEHTVEADVPSIAVFTDTWKENTATSEGYVTKGEGNPNKVWGTDASGVPGWIENSGGGADVSYGHKRISHTGSVPYGASQEMCTAFIQERWGYDYIKTGKYVTMWIHAFTMPLNGSGKYANYKLPFKFKRASAVIVNQTYGNQDNDYNNIEGEWVRDSNGPRVSGTRFYTGGTAQYGIENSNTLLIHLASVYSVKVKKNEGYRSSDTINPSIKRDFTIMVMGEIDEEI